MTGHSSLLSNDSILDRVSVLAKSCSPQDSFHSLPVKLCECGCGQPTKVRSHTDNKTGRVKGEYNHFIRHHNRRGYRKPRVERPPGPPCECGCGEPVLWERHKRGWNRFVKNHRQRSRFRELWSKPEYREKKIRFLRERWKNTAFRENMLEMMSVVFNQGPTKPQIALYDIIHTFDDTFYLEGENHWHPIMVSSKPFCYRKPDIVSFKHRVVVEYDGEYWHKGKEFEDKFRDTQLEAKGYKVLHFGPDDLKNPDDVRDKIRKVYL